MSLPLYGGTQSYSPVGNLFAKPDDHNGSKTPTATALWSNTRREPPLRNKNEAKKLDHTDGISQGTTIVQPLLVTREKPGKAHVEQWVQTCVPEPDGELIPATSYRQSLPTSPQIVLNAPETENSQHVAQDATTAQPISPTLRNYYSSPWAKVIPRPAGTFPALPADIHSKLYKNE